MDALLERLRAHWEAQDIKIGAGAREEEVAAFERAHNVVLPPLFREYMREMNGMVGSDMDSDLISFWPLALIRSVAELYDCEERNGERGFVFADYLISSHDYAICLAPDSTCPDIIVVPFHKQVAPSFEEFLRSYLEGNSEAFSPGP
jgi:hypothetical protein